MTRQREEHGGSQRSSSSCVTLELAPIAVCVESPGGLRAFLTGATVVGRTRGERVEREGVQSTTDLTNLLTDPGTAGSGVKAWI